MMTSIEGILLHLPGPERPVEAEQTTLDPAPRPGLPDTAPDTLPGTVAGTVPGTVPDTAQAIAALVPQYSPLLFRVAHSILRSRPDAEDVVQETFLRVLQHRASLPDLRDPRVWLVRIAWNLALDRRRRIRPEQMDDLFAASLVAVTLPADAALAGQRTLRLALAEIERLPASERHVLLLSANLLSGHDQLDTPAIAAVLNRSESAVRALLFRARTRLRERIEAAQKKQSRSTKGLL